MSEFPFGGQYDRLFECLYLWDRQGQTDKQADRQTSRKTDRQAGLADRHAGRQTDTQADRQTCRLTDRYVD